MNNILTERLISLRELALMGFAIFLLAAAPTNDNTTETAQQPVKATVPVEQADEVLTNEA